ncbi:type I 3-dehydroquinate dehydratase [Rhodococcus artemisiae]|uniref:3-dehydroquinate dehydratase n=1 Tax=Rhodococcus artemisiae TaxID=714159 RepID=A0ABU7L6A3_9NOCA|nr:type I 3-dehydroquinate dehydratase [Rhodococcus artemisiae]MEE2057080.1 type I 3-dehydroquinate dehydratase [Rhodococcus artemisiae]
MGEAITPVRVKGVTIGEGAPKVFVPITGTTPGALREQVGALAGRTDLVEWRVDFFTTFADPGAVVAQAHSLAEQLDGVPLLATFRTAHEGGDAPIRDRDYADLNAALAESGAIDLVDVEYRRDPAAVERIIESAHSHSVAVVASNHDFDGTPERDDLVARMCAMQDLGADICKIAVMPTSTADVLTLLDATRVMHEEHASKPIITMSMGGLGVISRLAGQVFGSAATFGMVGTPSAPGQVDAAELRTVLDLLDRAR